MRIIFEKLLDNKQKIIVKNITEKSILKNILKLIKLIMNLKIYKSIAEKKKFEVWFIMKWKKIIIIN